MKHCLPLFLFFTVLGGSLALPQPTATTTKTTKKSPAKSTSSKTASSKAKAGKKPAVAAATWRNRQLSPTPERYKEIQQALVDKGYLKSEPNGVWNAESAAALTQFQTDQKLSPTGKLSSASLIALGLGPKTAEGAQVSPPTAPPAAPPAAPAPPAAGPAN
jgi:hypothetical protein